MAIPHLSKSKNGHYRYRRAVPEAFRETIGLLEIKKALGSDYATAMKRYGEVHKETERLFENAKNAPEPTDRDKVLRALKQAGVSRQQLETIVSGLGWGTDVQGLDGIWHGMVNEYEAAEAVGQKPKVSLEVIRAIGEQRLPPETYTAASALSFYLDSKRGPDASKNKQLENHIKNLQSRMIVVLGKEAVTKRPLEKFKREDARKLRDALLAQLNPNSVRRMFNMLRAAINKTIREYDLDAKNPLEKLEIKGAAASREDRYPFTEDDLKSLGPIMVKGPEDALGILWTILRDTGARNSEICRRKISEVDLENGSIAIPVGKSKNAVRIVPLSPSALAGAKFLATDKPADAFLFPSYATGRQTDSASQALMKRLRTVIKDEKKVVYSLRHRLKDRLRDTDCPADIQEEIMGHDAQNVAKNYGRGYSLEKKRAYLERVWAATPV
ncbi:tyrosine-type recombinase/integrase [Mesorhizobium sp. BR1-1-3]|uniref:tyrosine-type recombinase/integrase n=1 Tax=Mesorhizobium sp. BR1-1-3 TaxID=2876651 RepID=UPI001CD0DF3A|nr:tyrosine-type recombinase/integrase [Mesorhizobium sp. BR1-1-3]MBZ9892318.1 tyrosine-type recombinase/integrase [Mesorhizobium sp. BR1-1-3]